MKIFFNSLIFKILFVLILFNSAWAANKSYYIDATIGSDTNTGLSHAQAWKSLSRATSLADGSDVYLLCGETWTKERIAINWKGVDQNNYSVIGAYYVDDGVETIGVNGDGKPIIDGNNIHPSRHDGQIESSRNADYIWIENIELRKSAGYGINFDYDSDYSVIKNCKFRTMHNQSIWIPNGQYPIVESNEFYDTARKYLDDMGATGWPGTIELNSGSTNRSNYATVRFNKIQGSYGEGISPGDYATVMYNLVINTRSKGIYLNGNSYCEVAYNLVVGTNEATYRYMTSPGYHNAGICLSVESYRKLDTAGNKIHHNVVINAFAGIQVNNSHYPDYEISGNVIANNTFIDNYRNAYFFNSGDKVDFTNYYYNNLHYDNHADSKNATVAGSDKLDSWVFSHNHWYPSLNDYEIASANDTNTTGCISRTSWRGTSAVNNVSFTISDLAIAPESICEGNGKYLGEDYNAAWAPSTALPPLEVTKTVSNNYNIGAITKASGSPPSTPKNLMISIGQ
jgi:Right handed beta helix region